MRITALLILLAAFALQGNCQGSSNKNLAQFSNEMVELANILKLPGFSLAVVKNGKVVHRQMGGYANLEKKIPVKEGDLFMIASVTKTFTANLVMQYEQEHVANVDDPVLQYRYIDLNNGWPYNIDANTTLRHFMSHTSEDGPGNSFVYNGSRFNFIYGLFEAAGKHPQNTDAYTLELQKKVLGPLGLQHTISGFPASRSDTMFTHIATPYIYNRATKQLVEDTINYARWTRSLPSGGLLSTIEDLITYTNSYDTHRLLTPASYKKLTTPAVLNDGSVSPYGIGWFTESFAGKKIHWHYGQADSYAALFIRVPETGYTFIFLSNSNAPSEALRLGSGRVWQSPFATAFFKHFIFNNDANAQQQLATEDRIGRALFMRYTENMAGLYKSDAQQIIAQLAKLNPEIFSRYDPALTYLLTDLRVPAFDTLVDKLAAGYRKYGHIQPYVATDLAQYYFNNGMQVKALEFYKQLADAKGFETWQAAADACRKTGELLKQNGKPLQGRNYYWKAINNMKLQWADDAAIKFIIDEMNSNAISK